MSAKITVKVSMSVQRHVLTTGQCTILCARMLEENGVLHSEVIDSMLHLRVSVPAGKNRDENNKIKEKTSEIMRGLVGDQCRKLKAEKAEQRSYGHHSRR